MVVVYKHNSDTMKQVAIMVLLQCTHVSDHDMHSDIHGHKPIVWLMLLMVLDPLSLFEYH